MTREVLKQALETLEEAHYVIEHKQDVTKREQAITEIKKALAQPEQNLSCKSTQARLAASWGYVKAQPEQEPVAWMTRDDGDGLWYSTNFKKSEDDRPLYASPPKRQWVSLTEWEREAIAVECGAMSADWLVFMEAVERALKEKNSLPHSSKKWWATPPPTPDWKAEYLKTVDLHCETLDELREAQAALKEARHANEKHIARIVDLQTHIQNFDGEDR